MSQSIRIALIGSGFMGKAHSLALSQIPILFPDAPVKPVKSVVVDVTEELARNAARMFGFERWSTDWQTVVSDVSVDLVDIVTPNFLHKPIAIASAREKKHIFCEKPLSLNASESREICEEVLKAGVKHGMGFHYRKIPAIAYAKQLVNEGKIGEVYAFRGFYLNDWARDPQGPLSWRFRKNQAGSGVIGDQCTHAIDIARYLLGEITHVCAWTKTLIQERPLPTSAFDALGRQTQEKKQELGTVDVDDACALLFETENGVKGILEANRCASGRKNYLSFEVNGSKGSLYFDWERNNELWYCSNDVPFAEHGYKRIMAGPAHPWGQHFWPISGINIGYTEAVALNLYQMLMAIVEDKPFDPDFVSGWRIEEIVDAALEASEKKIWVECHRSSNLMV
ncbi:MAG: Gfo/Idh/MocA family oxidoreductase [Atribacterota bacterium]